MNFKEFLEDTSTRGGGNMDPFRRGGQAAVPGGGIHRPAQPSKLVRPEAAFVAKPKVKPFSGIQMVIPEPSTTLKIGVSKVKKII